MITQLIVNGIYLPQTSGDRYKCYPAELGTQVDMISGRRVTELRGHVVTIEWSYDYLTPALWAQLAAVLRSGGAFPVSYLPDDSGVMATSTFLVESYTPPVFAFSRRGEAYWHNVSFKLREVAPHD